jgi:integrase
LGHEWPARSGASDPKALGRFYDSDEYERLIQAAKSLDRKTHVIVLFGGEAGLRYEEIMILEWQDVDLRNSNSASSVPIGRVTSPERRTTSLRAGHRSARQRVHDHRQLRSPRVLCQQDASPLSADIVKHHVERQHGSGSAIRWWTALWKPRSFWDILEMVESLIRDLQSAVRFS